MKLICLGTSGYQPSEARHTSCYFIPELGVMFDAGTGMFRARQRLCRPHLDILLSHAHLDHVVGLSFVLGWRELNGLESLHVYGEATKIAQIKEHIFSDHIFPIMPPIEWRELPEEYSEFTLHCGAKVRWWKQVHPGGSAGYRLDYGEHSLAYVTDTTAEDTDPYLSQLNDLQLLIHECNFDDSPAQLEMAALTGHSCLGKVLDRGQNCRTKKLALVHTSPYGNIHEPIRLPAELPRDVEIVVPNDLDEIEF